MASRCCCCCSSSSGSSGSSSGSIECTSKTKTRARTRTNTNSKITTTTTTRTTLLLVLLLAVLLCGAPRTTTAAAALKPDPTLEPLNETLRVLVLDNDVPWSYRRSDGGDGWLGFEIELLDAMSVIGRFNYNISSASSFAALLDAMRDSGSQYDVAMGHAFASAERHKVFDFSQAYFEGGLQLLAHNDGLLQSTTADEIRRVVTDSKFVYLGMMTTLLVLIFSHIMWYFERKVNHRFSWNYHNGVLDAVWWGVATVTTVGYGDKVPLTTRGRLLGMLWMVIGIIVLASLTATISSELTLVSIERDITGLNDLVGRRVGTVNGTLSMTFLSRRTGFTLVVYSNVHAAHQGILRRETDAVLYDSPDNLYFATHGGYGKVHVVGDIFQERGYSCVLKKGSPYRDRLDRAVLALTDDAQLMQSLQIKWFGEFEAGSEVQDATVRDEIDFTFIIVLAIVLFLFLTIILFCRYSERKRTKRMWEVIVIDRARATFDITKPMTKERAKQMFRSVDYDRSGVITKEELYELMVQKLGIDLTEAQLIEVYRACDTSGDGLIDFDEFFKMITKVRTRVFRGMERRLSSLGATTNLSVDADVHMGRVDDDHHEEEEDSDADAATADARNPQAVQMHEIHRNDDDAKRADDDSAGFASTDHHTVAERSRSPQERKLSDDALEGGFRQVAQRRQGQASGEKHGGEQHRRATTSSSAGSSSPSSRDERLGGRDRELRSGTRQDHELRSGIRQDSEPQSDRQDNEAPSDRQDSEPQSDRQEPIRQVEHRQPQQQHQLTVSDSGTTIRSVSQVGLLFMSRSDSVKRLPSITDQ